MFIGIIGNLFHCSDQATLDTPLLPLLPLPPLPPLLPLLPPPLVGELSRTTAPFNSGYFRSKQDGKTKKLSPLPLLTDLIKEDDPLAHLNPK